MAVALGAAPLVREVAAQQQPKKVLVIDFDQRQVQGGLREIFGRENVNVGRSLARLVAARLAQSGLQIVEASGAIPFTIDPAAATAAGRAAGADAVVAGTVLGVVPANAQGSRSGLAITVSVPNIVDASGFIDMTREDFRSTLIGQFTEESVGQLVTGVSGMQGRIGAVTVAPVVAAAPVAAVVPMAAAPPSGPVVYPSGPFAWAPYSFRGAEHFRYQVQQREDGQNTEGFYQLDLQPAGAGQARMTVQGQVGTSSFQTSVTIPMGEGGVSGPQMMMTFLPLVQENGDRVEMTLTEYRP